MLRIPKYERGHGQRGSVHTSAADLSTGIADDCIGFYAPYLRIVMSGRVCRGLKVSEHLQKYHFCVASTLASKNNFVKEK